MPMCIQVYITYIHIKIKYFGQIYRGTGIFHTLEQCVAVSIAPYTHNILNNLSIIYAATAATGVIKITKQLTNTDTRMTLTVIFLR